MFAYHVLLTLVSTYSVLAMVLVIVFMTMKWTIGLDGVTRNVNRLAGSTFVVGIEIFSYAAALGWAILVIPWVDLFTFGHWAKLEDHGILTYFGRMNDHDGSWYFLLVMMNIIAAKASITLAEMARLVRGGRVRIYNYGFFIRWIRE